MTKPPNIVTNFESELNQLLDLIRGHLLVHPDPAQCGGVGACLMMRTEVEQEQELQRFLAEMAVDGLVLSVSVR